MWRDGQARVSSDLLGVRGGVEGWRCSVRPRKKMLDEVSFSGSRFFSPFTVKLEQSWENGAGVNQQSRDKAVYPTQQRGQEPYGAEL